MTLFNRQTMDRWAVLSIVLACAVCLSPLPTISQDAPAQRRKVEDILAYADLLFSREQYGIAAQQYQIFIKETPKSGNLQTAWFRLGECYLKVQQIDDAITTFDYLIKTYRTGPFVGSAAYRIAVLKFNTKDYGASLVYFKIAQEQLTNQEAKIQAQYYRARSLQLLEKPEEALVQFEAVLAAVPKEENPFYERCLLETARISFDLGETEKALASFAELAETAQSKEFKEEAIVRGGLLAAEAGQPELSEKLLNQALRFSDTSPWKSLAQVGSIFNAFSNENYDRVIALYNTGAYSAPDESRAKMLLIVGHSFRIQGDLDSAVRLYSLVESKYPERKEGIEAGYRKLQVLHQQGDRSLPDVAADFADKQRRIDPESSFIDMAYLMKAEWHFNQAENSASGAGSEFALQNYKDAAAAYKRVRTEKIDEKYHEAALYKQGWSEIEAGDKQNGILSLSRFIQRHSDSSLASSALAKRAMAYQAQEDHQFALGDYEDITKRYPDAPEVEFSLQQIALIYAHQRKISEMINAYNDLLDKFPETDGAGEAHYWIGVGYFDLDQHQQAVPELEKAREMAPDYDDKATLRLVICHYQLENIPKLAVESRRYLEAAPAAESEEAKKKRTTIPPQILEYLGRKLAADNEDEDAEYFLASVADDTNPKQTAASIWKLLAETRVNLKKHAAAIKAYDNYLIQTERPSERASAYLERGEAQLCLRDFEGARSSAQESLRSQKEGRTNAEARILLGDISAADGKLGEAARDYLVVSQIFTDPEVTPRALTKAINAYRSLGDQVQADKLQSELDAKFPGFTAPEDLDRDC